MRRAALCVLPLLALVLTACAINPPRIVAISPGRDSQEVATNQEIRITFDRAMNHQSVESRFELQPPLGGCQSSPRDCRFAWTGDTLVFLHARINFEVSTQYSVRLKAGYADSSGQANSLDHSWHFNTEARPSLASVDPPDNSTSVPLDRNIVLSFSRPMRADTIRSAIQITPDTPFLIRGRPGGDGSQYEVIPELLLQPDQQYTLSVDRPSDTHGNSIANRLQTRFHTGSLSLPRRIGFLAGERDQPAFGIGVVDPHPDAFLQRSTPKLAWKLADQVTNLDAILSFDWAPDGQRLVLVDALRGDREGAVRIVNLATGSVSGVGAQASDVYWSPDGSILYLTQGTLRRFRPGILEDTPLTDTSDGRVIAPLVFSPDGKSVAYAATDAQQANHLWIMNLDLKTRFKPPGLDDPADHPSWSLDGTRLAFRRLVSGSPALWIYDLSASGSSAYRRAAPLDLTSAAWLNDNSTLIAGTGAGSGGALYRVNIFSAGEAGGLVKVTGARDAPNGSSPATPLYDRRVAFVGLIDELPEIFVMNGDGSRPLQLTQWEADFPYTGMAPNWTTTG